MSNLQDFFNPQVGDAAKKMYGQVYALTELQEKLKDSTESELNVDSLLDFLSFAVDVARSVVKDLHHIDYSQRASATQTRENLEPKQQQAVANPSGGSLYHIATSINDPATHRHYGVRRQGEFASMLGASGFNVDSTSPLSMLGESMEEQYDANIITQKKD